MDEISILDIAKILLRRIWFLVVVTVLCAGVALVFTKTLVNEKFMATGSLYVTANPEATQANVNDINAAEKLVNSYILVLQSDRVANEILDDTQLEYTKKQLQATLSMNAPNNGQVLKISATTENPEDSITIINSMLKAAPEALKNIAGVGEVAVIDQAVEAPKVSPSVPKNTLLGALLGLVLSAAIVLIRAMLDRTIKGEKDIEETYKIAVLGCVPDFNDNEKGGYSY